MKIELGNLAKDTVTGMTGIVVARTEWMNGCVRLTLQPREVKDGKAVEGGTFDLEQVEYIDEGVRKSEKVPTGGDRPTISRAPDPGR